MIKFVSVRDVLPLRNEVLRAGKLKPEECIFLNDDAGDTFHLGYYDNGRLVSVASFHQHECAEIKGCGYQLRGMATLASHRGQGIGTQLLSFATDHFKNKPVNYLWCNARKAALAFYVRSGFEVISEEFEIQGIGPHYKMYVKLR